MKKICLLITLLAISISGRAQLSENEKDRLAQDVKRNYEFSQIEGASLYKTKTGFEVLVTVVSVSTDQNRDKQNEEAREKSTRLAAEFLSGAVNQSVTVYEGYSTSDTSHEQITDKIVQYSLAQVKNMQPLLQVAQTEAETVYAYYLVISQTAAKNGVAGVLSIIPGVGQFYKGSTGKGIMFLSLAAASAAGIIVCESTRASYASKAISQPKYRKEYSNDADNWATGRNICIGVGGAIWLWNIIDAFATKSAKRKVVTSPNSNLSIQPYAAPDITGRGVDMGVGLTLNF